MTEKKSFRVKWHHRYDLRDWLTEQFPFLVEKHPTQFSEVDLATIRDRAIDIYEACMKIRNIDLNSGSAYISYYKNDWEKVEDTYLNKDHKGLAVALETLIDAINVE